MFNIREHQKRASVESKIVMTVIIGTLVLALMTSTMKVHAQAIHFQGGTCTGPDKECGKSVITPSGNTNSIGQSHDTGFTPQGPGAAVNPTTCIVAPTPTCNGSVFTPSGNINTHQHNTTGP